MRNGLCDEIDANYERLNDQQLKKRTERMKREFARKLIDPNVWAGFYKRISIYKIALKIDEKHLNLYRYLSNNEVMTFIHRGYYHAIKPYEQRLTLFYFDCENLSVETQQIEAEFHHRPQLWFPNYPSATEKEKWQYPFDLVISTIMMKFKVYRPRIYENYQYIHPYFRKNFLSV